MRLNERFNIILTSICDITMNKSFLKVIFEGLNFVSGHAFHYGQKYIRSSQNLSHHLNVLPKYSASPKFLFQVGHQSESYYFLLK